MNAKQLNTLEFPKILKRLETYAAFSASKALALALEPTPYFSEAHTRQAETAEAYRLLEEKPTVGVGGARDVRPLVEQAERAFILSASDLMTVRQTLIAARDLERIITRLAETYPHLADIAGRIEPCPGLVNEIGQAIDDEGEVKSSASPTLARLRREIEVAHNRLMERLNRLISSGQYSHYLQDALVTQRGGRYVVPVKAEFRGRIQGIVHDQSASGATIFVEPIGTVDLNNRWRALQLEEDEEIRRILRTLSESVAQQGRFIAHTVAALADLDLAFARAKYAVAINAVAPILYDITQPAEDDILTLVSARHPLLDPKTVVPIDLSLDNARLLVITGPNTGGKTVTLKTVGLLAAMAQAGLWIPAGDGSRLPVFNHILADIGDEQSIEQSLSTFSGHMTNLVQILSQCDAQSLVILDEVGAGTDPVEGSALAQAILTYLLERKVTTFVATHYSDLKAYAHTTAGVANASMEFNLETLTPTYRLLIGIPGTSNAFTIAARLGLFDTIVNSARELVSEDAQQVEAMLAEIKAQKEAAEAVHRAAEAERQKAENYTQQLEQRLAEIDTERKAILDSARADARREIKATREEIRAMRQQAEAQPTSDTAAMDKTLAKLDSNIAARTVQPTPKPKPPQPTQPTLRPGDTVYVNQFGTTGEVVSIQGQQVEIQMGHFRTTVSRNDIERRKGKNRKADLAESSSGVAVPAVASPGIEIDLRGQMTHEAVANLEQYLDQAFMAGLPWVHIIHGKGSGALRQAVRGALSNHPMVSSYRAGDPGEGGEGVTVAKLVAR